MKNIRTIIVSAVLLTIVGAAPAIAQSPTPTTTVSPTPSSTIDPGTTLTPTPTSTKKPDTPGKCGTTRTQLISCSSDTGVGTISDLIKLAITVMSVLIGIVATGGFAYAAVLYATAQDDQEKVHSAITVIRNIVIGLIMYGFTIAIINWLIPGGVIG